MGSTFAEWTAGGRLLDVDGHRIFVRQDGPADGRPLTLLHGFPTSSHDWAPVMPDLDAAGVRSTTLDFLGFGASDKPAGHRYRLTEQADIVEAVWAELGIAATALVAHDYGVSVAQELLARDPDRITRTAWLNGGVYPDLHRPIPAQRLLHSGAGKLVALLVNERSYRRTLRSVLGRPVSEAALHEMWLSISAGHGRRVQWQLLRYIDDRRSSGARWVTALEGYPGPMLFIWGPADPVSGAHVLPRLRERLPRARYVVLDDPPATGHYPQIENPRVVAAALVPFLY